MVFVMDYMPHLKTIKSLAELSLENYLNILYIYNKLIGVSGFTQKSGDERSATAAGGSRGS